MFIGRCTMFKRWLDFYMDNRQLNIASSLGSFQFYFSWQTCYLNEQVGQTQTLLYNLTWWSVCTFGDIEWF